jgi:site-specific DNA recombinase
LKKTVIYARQSLNAEKQQNSIDVQKDFCLAFARKKGWLVHEFYNEGEKSARITEVDDRPVISKLLFDASQGNIERLIVYKRDRLARNVEQYLFMLTQLQRAKVQLYFAAENEPPVMSGPIGEFVELLLAGVAQQEGENIHRRQIETKQYLASKGLWCGSKLPYGYTSKEGKTKCKAEIKKVVALYYKEFIRCWDEEKSLEGIVKEMKKHPCLHDLDKNKLINRLPQKLYKGYLIQKLMGKTFGPHRRKDLRMIDAVTWNHANYLLKITYPELGKEKKESYQPLLVGKIRCGKCSDSFLEKGNVNYSCPNDKCKVKVVMHIYDSFVLKKTIKHFKHMAKENLADIKTLLQKKFLRFVQSEKEFIEKNLIELEEKLTTAFESYIEDKNDHILDGLVNEFKEFNEEHGKIKNEIYNISQTIQGLDGFKCLDELNIENMTYAQKKDLLSVLDCVVLRGNSSDFRYQDGKRGF